MTCALQYIMTKSGQTIKYFFIPSWVCLQLLFWISVQERFPFNLHSCSSCQKNTIKTCCLKRCAREIKHFVQGCRFAFYIERDIPDSFFKETLQDGYFDIILYKGKFDSQTPWNTSLCARPVRTEHRVWVLNWTLHVWTVICICSFRCSRKRRRARFGLAVCETRLSVCAPHTACKCTNLSFSKSCVWMINWQDLNAHANDKLSWQRAAVACQLSWASFLGLSQSVEIAGGPTQLRAPIIVTTFHPTSDGPAV